MTMSDPRRRFPPPGGAAQGARAPLGGSGPVAMIVKRDGQDRSLAAESLVFNGRMIPCNELHKILDGKVSELYAIGDCVEPRLIINAMWEAFHTARKIEG